MNNQQFPYYIEDWILWLGRAKDALGNDIDFPYYKAWPVKLANYDVTFIIRSTDSIRKGIGFTQRQLVMATKIVTKYQRQITQKIGRDVGYLDEQCPHRLDLRDIDRSFSLNERGNHYQVKFPYDPQLVDRMHKFALLSTGDFRWDKANRQWNIARTERNLALIVDFMENHNQQAWHVSPSIVQHITAIEKVKLDPCSAIPHLDLVNGQVQVVNSNPHLAAGLAAHNFDFDDDIANLVIRADCFGLAVGPKLTEQVKTQYSNIADALLATQTEIQSQSKAFNSYLTLDNLEQFMTTVRADLWVFISSFSSKDSKFTAMADCAARCTNATGKKVFYEGRLLHKTVSDVNNSLTDIDDVNCTDTIVISDSVALLAKYCSQNRAIQPMRQFYLFGEN